MTTRFRRLATLAAAGIALAGSPALAQTTPALPNVEPYWAMVTGEQSHLHAGPAEMMYTVLKLRPGQLLRVDGEGPDAKGKTWSRVAYPEGAWVYLQADAVQTEPDGKTGGLTKAAVPKAPNLTNARGSWYPALPQGLQAGAKVEILDVERGPDGNVTTYKIAPPENARAYAPTDFLRRATPEEIASLAGGTRPLTPIAPAPNQPQQASIPQGASPANLAEPMAPAGNQTPIAPAAPTTETASTPAQPEPVQIEQAPREPSPYERLETAFEAMRQQPFDAAEFSALMSEYQAELAKIENTPANRSLRGRITQRIEFLRLRADFQAARQALAESEANIDSNDKALADRLAEVDRTRQYTIVGRLSASTLYDGKTLPLMYRVQTIGGPSARTIAYVKPDEKLAIASKLGQVVGLIGESRLDSTLNLNILTPLRIDTLEAAAPAVADVPVDNEPAPGQQ